MSETMQLNKLATARGARPKAKRVGRGIGSGMGKTCGRGHKGYGSRSGSGIRRGFEGGQMPIQRRLPKIGFRSRVSLNTEQLPLHALARFAGQKVTLDSLREAGLIRKSTRCVKIYLKGEFSTRVDVIGVKASKGAREAIEKAGGSVADLPKTSAGKPQSKNTGGKVEKATKATKKADSDSANAKASTPAQEQEAAQASSEKTQGTQLKAQPETQPEAQAAQQETSQGKATPEPQAHAEEENRKPESDSPEQS